MKNKRWLFILLFFLFVINIAFWVVTKYTRYDLWLKNQIIGYVEKSTDIELNIENLAISDKQLKLSGIDLNYNAGQVEARIEHLYFNYNLLHAVFSKIKLFKAIESISIIEPAVTLRLTTKEKKHDGSPSFQIPKTLDFFKTLRVANGSLNIEYKSDEFNFIDSFHNINIQVDLDKQAEAKLTLKKEEGEEPATIELYVVVANGEIEKAEYNIRHYSPAVLEIKQSRDIDLTLDVIGIYNKGLVQLNGTLTDFSGTFYDKRVEASTFEFLLYDDRLFFSSDSLLVDDNSINLTAEVTDLFAKKELFCTAVVNEVSLEKYIPELMGDFSLEAKVSGSLDSPLVTATAFSKRLSYQTEIFYDVSIAAEYEDERVIFTLENAEWESNKLSGTGEYTNNEGFHFQVAHQGVFYHVQGIDLKGNLLADVYYNGDLKASAHLDNLSIANEHFTFANLTVDGELTNNDYQVLLLDQKLRGNLSGNLSDNSVNLSIILGDYNLNGHLPTPPSYLKSYPHLTGSIIFSYLNQLVNSKIDLKFANPIYGELEGGIYTRLDLDLESNLSNFILSTQDLSYHNIPVELLIRATGTSDSLATTECVINEDLKGKLWVKTSPSLKFGFDLTGEEIKLQKYISYITEQHSASNYEGDLACTLSLSYPESFTGQVNAKNLAFDKLGYLKGEVDISYNKEEGRQLKYTSNVTKNEKMVLSLEGKTELNASLDTSIKGEVKDLELQSFLPELDISGQVNSLFDYTRDQGGNVVDVDFTANNFKFRKTSFDKLNLRFTQSDTLFTLTELDLGKKGVFDSRASGKIGLNIFTNRLYSSNEEIDFTFQGDVLKVLSENINFLDQGKSKSRIDLSFGIKEEELNISSGNFQLDNGSVRIAYQMRNLEKILLDIVIKDNRLIMNRVEGEIGDGKVFVRNEILEDENDFMIGMLNLGQLFCKTSPEGVIISIPSYIPSGTAGNVIVKGRNTPEATIRGPFDDIKIQADLYLSSVSVIFPSNTENLFRIINLAAAKKEESSDSYLPLTLDLKLIANKQIRYATYPVNLLLMPKNYINITHKDDEWNVVDAYFSSEKGTLDMFGTTFNLDYAEFTINDEIQEYRVNGSFFKYASDGSLITLNVHNDPMGGTDDFLEKFQFDLSSDNSEDRTTLHILSKLRYNRKLDDIPRNQQNALLQDEFMQLAGIGLAGAIVDPFIYPLENRLRQLFRLDFVSIRPSFVENIVRTYGTTENSFEQEEESEIIKFSKNILLDNFSVTMGKFIARDLFLDYELLLQKPIDVISDRDILFYNNFTLNYNLPLNLRFAYRFYLTPENEPNSHEVFIRRSFSFW